MRVGKDCQHYLTLNVAHHLQGARQVELILLLIIAVRPIASEPGTVLIHGGLATWHVRS